MSKPDPREDPSWEEPRFTPDGRHIIRGYNDGKFRAPMTRSAGASLIIVGVFLAFGSEERGAGRLMIVAGILVLVFARLIRHVVVPDCWYIAEDDRKD